MSIEKYECAFHFQCESKFFNLSEYSDNAHKSSATLTFQRNKETSARVYFRCRYVHMFLESTSYHLKSHTPMNTTITILMFMIYIFEYRLFLKHCYTDYFCLFNQTND